MGIISSIAPRWALKRQIARQQMMRLGSAHEETMSRQRAFETAAATRQRNDLLTESGSPDTSIHKGAASLRGQIRHLEQNTGSVSGPIQRMLDNVIGDGIKFQSVVFPDDTTGRKAKPKINKSQAAKFRADSEWNFGLWVDQADQHLRHNFHRLQRLAFSSVLRDGAVLVIGRKSERPGRLIPYCLELLEIDRLQTPKDEAGNPRVRHGIMYDKEGVPEFYLVLKQHPGDTLNMNLTMEGKHFEQIPAYHRNGNKKVMHLFNPVRPEQTIGYTIFASAVKDLLDGDRYMDAEKMAALEDACMTAVITTENAKTFAENFADVTGSASETFKLQHEFGTNEQWYMEPGQDVSMHKPTRPNNQLRDYMEQILSGPANAVNMPPEVYSQNFRGLNYSNARTILLNLYAAGRTWQNFMISDLCVPVWHQTASWFIQKGLIGVNTPFGLRKHDWLKSTWIPAVFRRWIDPLKEAKGKEVDLNNNIETLTDVLAEQGKDFDEHILKRGREIKKMAEVEEQLGIKFPSSGSAAQPVAEGEEEGEEAGAGSPPGSEEDQRTLIEEAVEEYIQNNTIRMLGR